MTKETCWCGEHSSDREGRKGPSRGSGVGGNIEAEIRNKEQKEVEGEIKEVEEQVSQER